jgi:hypothetical protein
MRTRLLSLPIALLLALGAAADAHAQSRPGSAERVELPVWNRASGEIEAVLVLESTDISRSKVRARFGARRLDDTFGLSAADSLGVLCDGSSGLGRSLNRLAENCVLAAVPDRSRRSGAAAVFHGNGNRIGVGAGSTQTVLPGFLSPTAADGKVDINDLSVFAQKDLPREGYVSIAGTVAKARLQSPAEIPGFADRWTSRQLNLGGGVGDFGFNIVGEVVDTGQDKWEGLSLGLSWRTPWSGQLTVGADNVVTRGKNPFAPAAGQSEDEGAVPYVRYEQDL